MKLLPLLPIVLLLLTTASCTKVIDIDVKESDTRYVIEGVLTEEAGSCRVTVSRTRAFNEPNDFPPVTGATVTITNNGQLTTLAETAPGVYRSSLKGVPGHTYNLSVRVGSDVFTAMGTMPAPVLLDTLRPLRAVPLCYYSLPRPCRRAQLLPLCAIPQWRQRPRAVLGSR